MKASHLHDLREQNYSYDPRPPTFRSQVCYPHHFRNTVLNYQVKLYGECCNVYDVNAPHFICNNNKACNIHETWPLTLLLSSTVSQ